MTSVNIDIYKQGECFMNEPTLEEVQKRYSHNINLRKNTYYA